MQKQELKKFINQIILRVRIPEQIEENKLELKSEWYNFIDRNRKKQNESEFLKDLAAIANTTGPTGYLIIGINEKTGELKNSPISKCGFQDISYVQKLVVKAIDKPVDFEYLELTVKDNSKKSIIAVFVIPPSLDKPHVIGSYLSKKGNEIINYIPVKKATNIYNANRSDIELMYYDRKNIEPEYALELKSYKPKLGISSSIAEVKINFQICFQNYGRKPIAIVECALKVSDITHVGLPTTLQLKLEAYNLNFSSRSDEFHLSSRYIVIPGNSVETIYCHFQTNFSDNLRGELVQYLRSSKNNYQLNVEATDLNGKKYFARISDFG